MTRTKVCGLTSEADVRAAVEAGADAVGFIVDVDVETPREIAAETAATLEATVPPFVTTTLVTMPDNAAQAITLADLVQVDAIQIHGLDPSALSVVVESFRGPVIPAIAPDEIPTYGHLGDALLVDTPSEGGGGGTGETHDWTATREATADLDRPLILAGGLTPDNVTDAIDTVEPYGVDVASGVESAPSEKDPDAVAAFVERAHGR